MSLIQPDVSRTENTEANQFSDVLGARLLGALLNNKAFREIIKLHADEFQRAEGSALVKTLLTEDPELWLGLTSAGPKLIDATVDSLAQLGKEFARMPETLVDAYVSSLIRDVDTQKMMQLPVIWAPLLARALPGIINTMFQSLEGLFRSLEQIEEAHRARYVEQVLSQLDVKQVAQTLNAFTRWIIHFEKDNPELIASATRDVWSVFLEQLDSGKLRECIVAQSRLGRDLLQHLLGQMLSDPVTLANVVSVLPTLVNDFSSLLAFVLQNLSLPDEVLASAIFNLLNQIDTATLAQLINGLSATVCTLHQGSRTLGLNEPAFFDVFRQLFDGVADALDSHTAQEALVAMAEDLAVVLTVSSTRLTTHPESFQQMMNTVSRLVDIFLRSQVHLFGELAQIPDASWHQIAHQIKIDGKLLAQWINLGLRAADGLQRESSESTWWSDAKAAIEWQRLGELLIKSVRPMIPHLIESFVSTGSNHPERLACWTNQQLQRLNQIAQTRPDSLRYVLTRFWSTIDKTELNRAWLNVGKMFARLPLAPLDALLSKVRTLLPLAERTLLQKTS